MKAAILIFLQQLYFSLALADYQNNPPFSGNSAGCETKCGNVTVPYPFGIGINSSCSFNSSFDVICDSSTPKLLLPSGNQEITDISYDHVRIKNKVAARCYTADGNVTRQNNITVNLTSTPFSFSNSNLITVVGCDDAIVATTDRNLSLVYLTYCPDNSSITDGQCAGIGCWQSLLPKGQKSFGAQLYANSNHTLVHSFNPCGYGFVGDRNSYQFNTSQLQDPNFQNRTIQEVPIVLDWAIGNQTCDQAKTTVDYACKGNSSCVNSDSGFGGYRCYCLQGYQGNPYLTPGCTDIDECKNNPCSEFGKCINAPGNFTCSCKPGYDGDGNKQGRGCVAQSSKFPALKFSVGFGVSFISLLLAVTWLYFCIKKRRLSKMREKFFTQNGGLLLTQQKSSGGIESSKIFSAAELEKATNRYAEDRVLGRGGYGTVYRGILTDKRVVAIKKSRIMDKSQIEPFINEVIILAQINHRNVVKLLGFCLETDIPLLVYEYISNGTLYEHIHNEDESSRLPWKERLRIAAESAGALAYLHSAASVPVIHRDVKLSNILLDHSYTAKLSDFGASRLISLDQTQVTTLVQGTLGYLDPEYFQTSQLTVKSDVYSFGVVLAELLTGKKPITPTNSEQERNLASYFLMSITEKRLTQILEPQILRECNFEELQQMGDLVKRCLNLKGDERPTMKEVAVELERLYKHKIEAISGEKSGFTINLSSKDSLTQASVETSEFNMSHENEGQPFIKI